MRILFLGNNWVGWQVALRLMQQQEEIVGAVLHPADRQKYGDDLYRCFQDHAIPIFDGSMLKEPDTLDSIRKLHPELGLSIFFGYILQPSFLSLFPHGVLNLHPSYLPYNKGANPNVWSIIEGTPAGATLHFIDPGIDTGDIVAQIMIPVEPVDTAKTLYSNLERACINIFESQWPAIRTGNIPRRRQNEMAGTSHMQKDMRRLDRIELDKQYTGRELINILRARTFPPYPGAYFEEQGRRVYARIQLSYNERFDEDGSSADPE